MRNKITTYYKTAVVITSLCTFTMLSGCASQANKDPLEGLNRGVYKFNDVTDKAVFKPVATAYKTITPVSYTHLDVYKRQALTLVACNCP